jgi:hypothetical protein
MSDGLKLPVVGFPGGILQIVQPLPPSPHEFYRADFLNSEEVLYAYLRKRRASLVDPYPNSDIAAIH